MDERLKLLSEKVPEREGIISVTSPGFGASSSVNSGFVNLILKQPDQEKNHNNKLPIKLLPQSTSLTGARIFITQQQTSWWRKTRWFARSICYCKLQTFNCLKNFFQNLLDETRNHPIFTVVDVNLKFNKPEIKTFNR